MSNTNREKLFRHPGLAPVESALIREGRLQVIAAVALTLVGLSLALFLMDKNRLFTAISWTAFFAGLFFLYRILLHNTTDKHPLVHLLKNNPEQIVWVYSVVTQRMPFGFQIAQNAILYFKLLNGDEISVELPVKQVKLVSKTLNRLLPHACFGYSDERADSYLTDPKSLLRNNPL